MSVCFVRTHISETARPNFTCRLWPWPGLHLTVLCTSGFLDDVMFSYTEPHPMPAWHCRNSLGAMCNCARAIDTSDAWYSLRSLLDDGGR